MTDYEIKNGYDWPFRYMVYKSTRAAQACCTFAGAKRWIKRDKARLARSLERQLKAKPHSVVYREEA